METKWIVYDMSEACEVGRYSILANAEQRAHALNQLDGTQSSRFVVTPERKSGKNLAHVSHD